MCRPANQGNRQAHPFNHMSPVDRSAQRARLKIIFSQASRGEIDMLPTRSIFNGESLPVYGMGSWKTFDVAPGPERNRLQPIVNAFFAGGGRVIDTSPMYGQAEA